MRTGASRFGFLILLLTAGLASGAWAQKPGKAAAPQAVIAGTVFREPGFAVAGAEAELTVVTPPAGQKRVKGQRARTTARGEFFFYLPAAEAVYRVRASAPGLEPQEREVRIQGEERADVYFNLKPLPQ